MKDPFRRTGNERIDAVIDVANVVLGDEPSEPGEEEVVSKTYRSIRLELTKAESFGSQLYQEMAEESRQRGLLDVDITAYVDDELVDYLNG